MALASPTMRRPPRAMAGIEPQRHRHRHPGRTGATAVAPHLELLERFFHFPPFDSLAEAFVKAEGKGAIAAFAPSGLSVDAAAHLYHKALLSELQSGSHARFGDAPLRAQEAYADTGAFPELLAIYHLFGDPAMRIR